MKKGILAIISVAAIGILAVSSASAQEIRTETTADLMRELKDAIAKGGIPTTPSKPAKVVTQKDFAWFEGQTGRLEVYSFDLPGWMFRYGSIARQDPDFKRNKGSSKAFLTKRDSNVVRNRDQYILMAQRYAVSQATSMEPGPTGLVRKEEMFVVSDFIVSHLVIYGVGEPGDFPHKWIINDQTSAPWCYKPFGEIFYGAAKGTDGKWYFAAITPYVDPPYRCSGPEESVSTSVPGGSVPKKAIESGSGGGFPIKAGQNLGQMRLWYTPSRKHYLVFQTDGNLVVRNADGTFVWGLNLVTPRFAEAKSAWMEADGNLVVRGLNGTVIWSALTRDLDPGNSLTVSPEGVLQLISGKTGATLWSNR